MLSTQICIVIKQSTNLELKNHFLTWNECEELTHSQQQPQAPNAQKKKPEVRLTTRITMLWAPKGPFFTGSWSQLRSSARHTLSNNKLNLSS